MTSSASPDLLAALGAVFAIFLSSAGACYASSYAGVFAMKQSHLRKGGFIPIIISGVLAIYGTIVAVLLQGKINDDQEITTSMGYRFLAAGLAVGSACVCSGFGIATFLSEYMKSAQPLRIEPVGEGSEPLMGQGGGMQTRSFVRLLMVLVFLEAIGLYGLIVALFLIGK